MHSNDIAAQLEALTQTLGGHTPADRVSAGLSDHLNLLVGQAKDANPGHPVLAGIEPIGRGALGDSELSAGELESLAHQVLEIVQSEASGPAWD